MSYLRRPSLISAKRRMAAQDNTQQTTCFSKMGAVYGNLANNGSSGEMKLVAAGESIFYNFIILQAFPKMKWEP
jgi:hypothetical protein